MNKYKIILHLTIFCLSYLLATYSYADIKYTTHHLQGIKFEKTGQFEKAIVEYEKCLKINPTKELYLKIGNLYLYESKNYPRAINIFSEGLESAKNDFGLNLGIMYSYFRSGDFNKGITYYLKLCKINKDLNRRFSFPRKVVDDLTKGMNEAQAIEFCEKYLRLNQTDIILVEKLASINIKIKNYSDAKDQYEAMLRYGYNKGEVYFNLAVCEYNLKNYQKALTYLTAAQREGEDIPPTYFEMIKKKLTER